VPLLGCATHTCAVLLPGYSPLNITEGEITATQPCPQKYYCPGGSPNAAFNPAVSVETYGTTVVPCPNGTFTQAPGASADDQCSEWLNTNTGHDLLVLPCSVFGQIQRPFLLLKPVSQHPMTAEHSAELRAAGRRLSNLHRFPAIHITKQHLLNSEHTVLISQVLWAMVDVAACTALAVCLQ